MSRWINENSLTCEMKLFESENLRRSSSSLKDIWLTYIACHCRTASTVDRRLPCLCKNHDKHRCPCNAHDGMLKRFSDESWRNEIVFKIFHGHPSLFYFLIGVSEYGWSFEIIFRHRNPTLFWRSRDANQTKRDEKLIYISSVLLVTFVRLLWKFVFHVAGLLSWILFDFQICPPQIWSKTYWIMSFEKLFISVLPTRRQYFREFIMDWELEAVFISCWGFWFNNSIVRTRPELDSNSDTVSFSTRNSRLSLLVNKKSRWQVLARLIVPKELSIKTRALIRNQSSVSVQCNKLR